MSDAKLRPRTREEQLWDEALAVWNLNRMLRTEHKRQAETIAKLQGYLRPFVEQVPHDKDRCRPWNPVGYCKRCELDAALKEKP